MSDTFTLDTISWVWDEEQLDNLVEMIKADFGPVVFDLETTGLNEHAITRGRTNGGVAARIVLASFTLPQYDGFGHIQGEPTTYLLPLSHPDSPFLGTWSDSIRTVALAMRGKRVVGHNVKFDCRWIHAATGVDLAPSIHWDTQISSHLLDETTSTKLKERAPDTFGVPRWDDVELDRPGAAEEEPIFKLGEYAARDTYWTWKLYDNHHTRMIPDPEEFPEDVDEARLGLLATHCAMPTIKTLTAIEQRGLTLDEDYVREHIAEDEKTRDESFKKLATRYEHEDLPPESVSFAPTSLWFRRWADEAVERGDLTVAALTPNGKPKWSKEVLTRQARGGSEVASTLLTYRQSTKRLEFLRNWLDQMTGAGRIYSTYNAGSVLTGRLSSSGPNMQQVTKSLRPAFVPTDGYYLVDLDYSQIELRVAAYISGSEPMINAFKRGDDLHTLLAARINSKEPDDVTPKERQAAKAANFGLLYGMGSFGFREYAETAYGVDFTQEEADQVHRTFFDMWDGLRQWHAAAMKRVRSRGFVVSPIGRIRRLEDDAFSNDERKAGFADRAAINSPVQGFASDIMQIAASCIEGNIPGVEPVRGARIVGTVHDSILVEVPIKTWEETTRGCQEAMEDQVPIVLERMGCEFNVPLKADAQVGSCWGTADIGEL